MRNATDAKDLITKWCRDGEEGGKGGKAIMNPSPALDTQVEGKVLQQGGCHERSMGGGGAGEKLKAVWTWTCRRHSDIQVKVVQ